jgi:formiminoglutamase
MIESFFEPVSKSLLKKKNKGSFVAECHINSTRFPDINNIDIAIIGLGDNANLMRAHLYQYVFQFNGLEIADFGDLKHDGNSNNINAGLSECLILLKELSIIPIIIGENMNYSKCLLNGVSYQHIDYAIVTPTIPFDKGDLTPLLNQAKRHFHTSFIGTQTFLNSNHVLQSINDLFCENIRLGDVRNDVSICEPLLRQADVFEFDLRSIKYSEFSSTDSFLPNGLFNNEACGICRYAGISNHLGIYLLNHFKLSKENISDQMQIAQMVWYILQGIESRFNDHPSLNSRNFTIYKCHGENAEEMIFINSLLTGRWWMQVPSTDNKKKTAPKYIGCLESDFEIANSGEVPEKWYRAKGF